MGIDPQDPESVALAIERYNVHERGTDPAVQWLSAMRPQARARYAVRLHQLEQQAAEEDWTEMARSLAIAILRGERDAEVTAQRVERIRKVGPIKELPAALEQHEVFAARHAGLLAIWFAIPPDNRTPPPEPPKPQRVEQVANGRAARALRRAAVETLTDEQRQAVPGRQAIKEGADPLGGSAGEDLL